MAEKIRGSNRAHQRNLRGHSKPPFISTPLTLLRFEMRVGSSLWTLSRFCRQQHLSMSHVLVPLIFLLPCDCLRPCTLGSDDVETTIYLTRTREYSSGYSSSMPYRLRMLRNKSHTGSISNKLLPMSYKLKPRIIMPCILLHAIMPNIISTPNL